MKKTSNLKYIIPIIVSIIIIYILVSMIVPSFSMVYVEPAQYETVAKTLTSEAYILRKESYITNDNGGVLYYNVDDAGSIATNGVIASIYESETDAINISKMGKLSEEINNLKKLNSMSQVMGASLESINKSINQNLADFIEHSQNNSFSKASDSLDGLIYSMNEKQIVTGDVTDFNIKIAELENERDVLEQSTKQAIGQIISPVAGTFMSQTDGYENSYDCNNIGRMSFSELTSLKEAQPTEVPQNVIGKIISDVNWYICCPLSEKDAEEFEDVYYELVDVNIPYASADTLSARVIAVNKDSTTGNAVVVLECEAMDSTLAKIRQEEVEISVRDYYGIKVEKNAVHQDKITRTVENDDGTTRTEEKTVDGVYILYGNELRFKEIVKLYETDTFVICDTDTENERLFSDSTVKLYDKIVTEGTDLYAGKIVKQSTEIQ